MGKLEGRVALVTGGASGIGRAAARRFATEGARVAVLDIDADGGGEIADEIGGLFLPVDVSDPVQLETAVDSVVGKLGRLDVALLIAGVGEKNVDVTAVEHERYAREIGVNIGGVVFGTKAAAGAMPDGGAIVAMASLAGLGPYPSDPIYGLSKHAVVGFVRSAAEQLVARGIRLSALCPSFVETPMLADMVPAFKESGFPLLKPEEVADAALSITLSDSSGEVFVCQPGRTCEAYRFRGIPGPRGKGIDGMAPPRLA
jgi:NAD(P)-dependent dehydrogenase (short-subunit alcohol dehydrogenase family)